MKINYFSLQEKIFIFPFPRFTPNKRLFQDQSEMDPVLTGVIKNLSDTQSSYFLNQKVSHLHKETNGRQYMKPMEGQSHI